MTNLAAIATGNKYRFHLLGLAHLPTSKRYCSCAFTQKNVKLASMLMSLGHDVFVYGVKSHEGPLPPCTEFIATHTVDDIVQDYGDGDNRFEVGYDWMNTDFKHDFNSNPKKHSTQLFNAVCIDYINKVKRPDDFLLCTQGYYHKPIADAVGLHLTCEPGIGYRGSVKGNFRAFESSYIQNFTYGSESPYECINGSYYDRVIPNYFDPEDTLFSPTPDLANPYYLFIGRMIKRKGILTAYLATKALGAKLIIVGQGASVRRSGSKRGWLVPNTDPDFEIPNDSNWEYFGLANFEQRNKLMGGALATFTPTEYMECVLPGQVLLGENKKIEDYAAGERVLQSDTNRGLINKVFVNQYEGSVVEIKPRYTLPLQLTPEHPVQIATFKKTYDHALKKQHKPPYVTTFEHTDWVVAKDVKRGDYVVSPKYKKEVDVATLDLTKYIDATAGGCSTANLASVVVDEDFLWMLGLYLAKGTICKGSDNLKSTGVASHFYPNQRDVAERLSQVIFKKLGCSSTFKVTRADSLKWMCTCDYASKFFEDTFGNELTERSLPWWILDLPKEKLTHFLKGYLGGGTPYERSHFTVTTASLSLALQLQLVLSKFDVLLGITLRKSGARFKGIKVACSHVYVLSSTKNCLFTEHNKLGHYLYREDATNFYIPVRSTSESQYKGTVYNLNTENNTFLVSNVVTHNCFAGTHVESMLCGTPPITTNFAVFPGTIPDHLDGVVGFRCNTLQDFVTAAKNAPKVDRATVRRYGERFLCSNVRWEFQKWFDDLHMVWESTPQGGGSKGWSRIYKE